MRMTISFIKWNSFFKWKGQTSTFGCNFHIFSITYLFFQKNKTSNLPRSTNATCREGRRTGAGKNVLSRVYRVFLAGDRQTKCLGGDRQRTVWCLHQHQLCYLRNRRTKCALTVSYRRPGKLGCRSNSPSCCAAQATSHVSSELCTFRCLVGHVCQRCGPVSWKTVYHSSSVTFFPWLSPLFILL